MESGISFPLSDELLHLPGLHVEDIWMDVEGERVSDTCISEYSPILPPELELKPEPGDESVSAELCPFLVDVDPLLGWGGETAKGACLVPLL
jgi:hypothetical protein